VLVTSFAAPAVRAEERFTLDEPTRVILRTGDCRARFRDLSLSGAGIDVAEPHGLARGDWLALGVRGVGLVPSRVIRVREGNVGLRFHLPASPERDALIRKIFTGGYADPVQTEDAVEITLAMLASIFREQGSAAAPPPADAETEPPAWLADAIAAQAREFARWDRDLGTDAAVNGRGQAA